jgi:hypothetical protein
VDLPSVGRYRRRFIVEFGPEDSDLVDRMGVAHKTKRAAILAGLRLLDSDESDQLRARIASLETDLKTAKASGAATGAQAQQSKSARAEVAADLRAERAAHRETKATLRATKERLAEARRAAATSEAECRRLANLIPKTAHCPNCDKLVPDSEWAETPARDGFDVYHKPDGYRPPGTMFGGPATVLGWRPGAGLPPNSPAASR